MDIAKIESLLPDFLKKKRASPKVTVCCLGHAKTVLLEMENRSGKFFIHKFEVVKNVFLSRAPAQVLKPFFEEKRFSREGIRVSLKGHGVVIRFIRFPKMKIEDLQNVMKYEAEQYIPFELRDVVLDFGVVDDSLKTGDSEKMEVMLVVIKRQDLEPTLEIFRNLECQLSLVDVGILAAMTALELFHPQDFAGHVGLVDLGTEISTLGIVQGGKPRFVRDISYGTFDLRKRLKTRSNLSEEKIDQIFEANGATTAGETQAIKESLDGLIGDLRVSFDYYRDQSGQEQPIQGLFLSGNISHPAVLKVLSDGLRMPVSCMDILSKVAWAPGVDQELLKANVALLPVTFGLGIREE